MPVELPSAFAHKLKTYEGFVSTNADTYNEEKLSLNKGANWRFSGKPSYRYWKTFDDANAVVIQLDGNYFVADTDDAESDAFVTDIMAKYGVVDNVTPSLSNRLLGKKNKNHYWFRLPEDIRWTCKAKYIKYDNTHKLSKLDLLGSKNRVILENIDCLPNLKNIPFMTREMLDDLREYVPSALSSLTQELDFKPVTKNPIGNSGETKKEKKNIVVPNFDDIPAEDKKYIDNNTKLADASSYSSWSVVLTKIANKYGITELGLKLAHYFSAKDPEEYDRTAVNYFYNKIDLSKESIKEYVFWKTDTRGKCMIQLDDDDLSEASTATAGGGCEAVVAENPIGISGDTSYVFSETEDRNFTTIAVKITPRIRKVLVYCQKNWYRYNNSGHIWEVIEEPQQIIKAYMFDCVTANNKNVAIKLASLSHNDPNKNRLVAIQKDFTTLYTRIESLQNIALVKKDLMLSLCDNKFAEKLDRTEGKIVFKDGIYDIATDTFREGLKYEDNLSYTLPYKYRKATSADKEKVRSEVMKICAGEVWRFNYYMEILGYSLLGKPDKEQVAFFMVGMTAGNGKSTLLEALTEMMPGYVVNLNSKTFSLGNNDFKKSINSIKGARIAWVNEVEKKKQDIDSIKQIADGKGIKNPVLFKQDEELIKIMAKLFFVSNGALAFTSDEGIKRRYRYVEFIAKFHTKQEYEALAEKREDLDYVKNTTFADFLVTENGFFALLELILEGALRWITNCGLNVPQRYADLATSACENNEEFAEFVSTNIVKSVGKYLSRYEIEERFEDINKRKMYKEKEVFRPYMATKGFVYSATKDKKVDGKSRSGCYMDCMLKEIVDKAKPAEALANEVQIGDEVEEE
jgi:phage/plasmid-associated DNA primase